MNNCFVLFCFVLFVSPDNGFQSTPSVNGSVISRASRNQISVKTLFKSTLGDCYNSVLLSQILFNQPVVHTGKTHTFSLMNITST